ncbi:unnamed protein product [Arctogadus glacialis]
MELFQGKGGVQGRKMRHLIVDISKDDTIETKRACVLKSLCVYLNEDPDKLFKDYMNTDTEVSACKAQTVLGVYAMKREGAEPGDELEDVGVLIEGEEWPVFDYPPMVVLDLNIQFTSIVLRKVHLEYSLMVLETVLEGPAFFHLV